MTSLPEDLLSLGQSYLEWHDKAWKPNVTPSFMGFLYYLTVITKPAGSFTLKHVETTSSEHKKQTNGGNKDETTK